MPQQVCMGAMLQCVPFGSAPTSLIVIPKGPPVLVNGRLAATIMDFLPIANIATFATCSSMANPVVAAATAAKLGVFTPMPCIPLIVGPWYPGAMKVKINKFPALPSTAVCNCAWGGTIKINFPGQVKVSIT
jgi:Domain of unknown function (DUF4280)